jgi:hypothetical protein
MQPRRVHDIETRATPPALEISLRMKVRADFVRAFILIVLTPPPSPRFRTIALEAIEVVLNGILLVLQTQ